MKFSLSTTVLICLAIVMCSAQVLAFCTVHEFS